MGDEPGFEDLELAALPLVVLLGVVEFGGLQLSEELQGKDDGLCSSSYLLRIAN